MSEIQLDAKKTALVLIDLQNGIVGREMAPHSAAVVMENGKKMAEALRTKGGMVVYIRVDFSDFMKLQSDEPVAIPDNPPAMLSEIAAGAGMQEGDLLITKRHWGAFAGTKLEEELRSRGVDTVLLGGIATNIGVESTARQGTGLGFSFVLVEDACATHTTEMHEFAFKNTFPRLSRVRKTDEVIAALA